MGEGGGSSPSMIEMDSKRFRRAALDGVILMYCSRAAVDGKGKGCDWVRGLCRGITMEWTLGSLRDLARV